MKKAPSGTQSDPRVFTTLRSDIERGDFFTSIADGFRDTKEFLLDEQRKQELGGMGWLKRWWLTAWWMLKAMFFRLTPARRLLFVLGSILILLGRTVINVSDNVRVENNTVIPGLLCLVLVLMLELKDKLVAHEELEAGRIVQDALKPEKCPKVPGWDLWLFTRSANEVGGDLVDFVRITDDRFGVVLGDVAGKGLRAALLMVKLQATLRALAGDVASLDDLAGKINHIFCRDSLRNIFASMLYLEIRPDEGRVGVLNAGHFPPVVLSAAGITVLEKGGAAFGLTTGATYTEQEIRLGAGDLLCAYSDGVSEAQNENGAFFGEQRIHDILLRSSGRSVGQVGEEIIRTVDFFIGKAKTRDDLTLVVMKRTG